MKFKPLKTTDQDKEVLSPDFKSGHRIGILTLGNQFLFFKKGFKIFYIPYTEITRAFRRVLLVPAKMCCSSGDLPVESLVLHNKDGEIADISVPGKNAAEILIKELKEKAPAAEFVCPPKEKNQKKDDNK